MFCEKCRALQEPKPGATHFDVLGVDQRFDINASDLTQKFRRLQSTLHPDKFTQKSQVREIPRVGCDRQCSLVQARNLWSDFMFLFSAEHQANLVELCVYIFQKETSLSEQHSAAVNRAYQTLLKPIPRGLYLLQLHGSDLEEGEIQMDPDFLMEIMEVNETLADCTDWAEIRDIDDKNKVILDELIREVAKHFDAADIRNAKKTLSKLKYYANIDDKVKEKERKQMDAR